jgi:putative mRNA 3-end processing factor
LQLIFHGGAQEVGRSCIELRTGDDRYLLDCGVKFHSGGLDYPAKVFESQALDGVFLSHAHLDHCGGLPFFEHYRLSCPIFSTWETQEMAKVLLKDCIRVARIRHSCEPFEKADLRKVGKDMRGVTYGKEQQLRTIRHAFFNAGHIPGSASVRIKVEGKTVLYTGDYNTVETELMKPADPMEWGPVDVLITEATYGGKEHPERAGLEQSFLAKIKEVIARGGRVLIPVFAVGRAQEVLLMLAHERWDVPVSMDGMAKRMTRITLDGPSPYVQGKGRLRALYQNVEVVDNPTEREAVASSPGIYVTTSGMLEGGPAVRYMEHIYNDPRSAVLLTGYQVQNTNGWVLDKERMWHMQGGRVPVQCEVARFDFSAHASGTNVQETILKVRPRVVIFNHGSPEAIAALTAWAKQNAQCEVFAPAVGDQIDIGEVASQLHLYTADDGYSFPVEHQHGLSCEPARQHAIVEHDE